MKSKIKTSALLGAAGGGANGEPGRMRMAAYRFATVAGILALSTGLANAQTADDLKADGRTGESVLTYGMGYGQQRYSKLDQINKRNVKKLVPTWSLSLENDFGEQAQPLIHDGVMYVSNAKWTVAIDAVTGKQLWRTAVDFDPDTPRVVCCGVSNKGVALYNGLVLRGTLDAYMVALDQKTGKEVWKTKVIDWKEGYSITSAPIVANGVLITGVAGGEFGIRGFLAGYDPATGKELWRGYMVPAPGEKGSETWPVPDQYQRGGGSTWITGSYDAELDLLYWGTGNAGPWNGTIRKGDALYTASMVAVRPKTGEMVWHYQFTPDDVFDYDGVSEPILADIKLQGTPRKVLMQLNRNGFAYVLDRANGKLLAANPFERINWASHVDMATGRPVETDIPRRMRAGETLDLWPSSAGGKNWQHAAFNPETGLLYTNTIHMASSWKSVPMPPHKLGVRYMGVQDIKLNYVPEARGFIKAIDPLTGKSKWEVPLTDHANWASMIATRSGLLFTGRQTGEFQAFDADTGKQLWQFQTGSGINSNPVTWAQDGKQYVTVLTGLGGIGRRFMGEHGKNVPLGGSVWTFALPD
ncbi:MULTISPECIES: PQQ-dependent dehydrogenase, methanol/ethanol family [Variovorax]|uniref:Alcohol dehydrogenase (Cytochrome c) n=1 Tax=Variovorax paradoxus TaxID=34073 RepID=A0AAW8ERM8_VARPD|nr:PQQ-dependent dehydrogenase, methanol/ethanol family [Variovorax paradoxus]MDP9974854.1 alcohol dehydrogenase (cytochrome c) [Variovorax paradoxus]